MRDDGPRGHDRVRSDVARAEDRGIACDPRALVDDDVVAGCRDGPPAGVAALVDVMLPAISDTPWPISTLRPRRTSPEWVLT